MEKIYVAKIGKAVGLKGFSKIFIDSDFPEQFKENSKFYTQNNQELIVQSYNQANDTVKFIGIESVEDAKKLTNKMLFTTKEDTKDNCKLDKNQFFWFDLMECKVIQNNECLGVVKDIQRLPLSDYFVVETSKELVEQNYSKSFLIPYVDRYIQRVDIQNKSIYVLDAKDILEAS